MGQMAWAQQGHPVEKQNLTVADVASRVLEAQTAAFDAQMDLNMEVKDTLSGQEQKSRGKVKMKAPDQIFAHYTQPTEQFLYIGKTLTQMYQPAEKMVYQQRSGKDSAPVYLGVGKQLNKYIQISKVKIIKDNKEEVGLYFIPKDKMEAGFDKMWVFIHKKDWWPYRIEMETPSMKTKAIFSNFSFNKGLKESLFKFVPPKGVQVVDGAVF